MGTDDAKKQRKNGKKKKVVAKKKQNGKKNGRPNGYTPQHAEIALKLCAEKGYTDENLADQFKISTTTLYVWKNKHIEFAEAIKKGKDQFDSRVVEQALLKRAKGYAYEEVTSEVRRDKDGKIVYGEDGEPEYVITKKVTKHMPSSDVSKIFWLKNRDPARWSDKKEIDHRFEETKKPLTEEELKERLVAVAEAGNGIDKQSIGKGFDDDSS